MTTRLRRLLLPHLLGRFISDNNDNNNNNNQKNNNPSSSTSTCSSQPLFRETTQFQKQNQPTVVEHSNMILNLVEAQVEDDNDDQLKNSKLHFSTSSTDSLLKDVNSNISKKEGNDDETETVKQLISKTLPGGKRQGDSGVVSAVNATPQPPPLEKGTEVSNDGAQTQIGAVPIQGIVGVGGSNANESASMELEVVGDADVARTTTDDTDTEMAMAQVLNEDDLKEELKEQIFRDVATADVIQPQQHKPWYTKRLYQCLSSLILFGIIIGISFAATKTTRNNNSNNEDDNNNNNNETMVPTSTPTTSSPSSAPTLSEEGQELLEFLSTSFPQGSDALLSNTTSPQYRAFLWLLDSSSSEEDGGDEIRLLRKYGLAVFYYALDGDNWVNNDGWLESSYDPCDEYLPSQRKPFGITCQNIDVMDRIELSSNNLLGTIPNEIALFASNLGTVDLTGNRIYGQLPPEIYIQASNIRWLLLGNNQLTGSLSNDIVNLWNLEDLDLQFNALSGNITTTLGMTPYLTSLNFESSGLLNGTIPTELGRLSFLKHLSFRETPIEGTIPDEIGNLVSLTSLDISGTNLNGSLPDGLYDLTKLVSLKIARIGLEGTISTRIGNLVNLQLIEGGNQYLSGTIPTEIGLLTALEFFRMNTNRFTGSIPTTIGLMSSLKGFPVSNNLLSSTIPSEIGNLNFVVMFLSNNGLTGTIPSELTNLRIFNAGRNNISSTIPPQILNNSRMVEFAVDENLLEGTIPTTIGLATSLKSFLVHANNLHRTLPTEVGQLTTLRSLAVSDNRLDGSLPTELGNLLSVEFVHLERNRFAGSIPDSLSAWADSAKLAYFHGNNLTGTLDMLCQEPITSNSKALLNLFADCEEVFCPCCTYCCNSTSAGSSCQWTGIGDEGSGEQPPHHAAPK